MLAGLLEVFLTGGIPPCIDEACPADTVYQATFRRVLVQNQKFYTRFPQDVQVRARAHSSWHFRPTLPFENARGCIVQ